MSRSPNILRHCRFRDIKNIACPALQKSIGMLKNSGRIRIRKPDSAPNSLRTWVRIRPLVCKQICLNKFKKIKERSYMQTFFIVGSRKNTKSNFGLFASGSESELTKCCAYIRIMLTRTRNTADVIFYT